MSDRLSRRGFLFYGGAAVMGVTLGQLARRQLAWADARAAADRGLGEERWTVSVCRECPAACGVRVRLIDGRPVKLEGNPLCPVSRGRLCAKGQAAIEAYYDPDRLTGPAKRVGPHGTGAWERISWQEATGLLAGHLRAATGRPGQVLAVSADETGPVADAWTRVWRAGGARVHQTEAATAARLRDRMALLTGVSANPHFDLEHATHVLSFGAPLVEDWLSPIWTQRSFGRFRRFDGRPRGRLVQIESRRSLTARKADEWIAVPTDRQVVLVYGIAAVLLRENRIDRSALEPSLGRLADFEQTVTTRFTPAAVAAATGVPVVTGLRLARDLAAAARPLVVVNADASSDLVDAVLALNMLLGAFDRPGGISAALPPAYTSLPVDAEAARAEGGPRVILLRDAAEFRSMATTPDLLPALSSAELVVSFSPYLDEAASVADLLLPAHTPLESWQAIVPATSAPGQAIAFSRPAAAPLVETRDLIQILKAVTDAVAGPLATACPWSSSAELVGSELARLAGIRRGGPYASVFETEWIRQLERGGWWTSAAASPEEFADLVTAAGGWADPFFEPGQIRRRILEQGGCSFLPPPAIPSEPLPPDLPRGPYPWRLETFVPATVNQLGSPNQPVLFELLGQPDARPWGPWVEMSPETAHAAGVTGRTVVRVESQIGGVRASVVLVEGMRPGGVALAFLPALPTAGRWAREITEDVRGLAADDQLRSGAVTVRIVPA